jgi:hypothetical protein
MTTYRIVARQTSEGGADDERYQVVDDEGNEYCRNAGGGVEDTPHFRLAAERFCELTGEDADAIDSFHSLEIDGVEQTPA